MKSFLLLLAACWLVDVDYVFSLDPFLPAECKRRIVDEPNCKKRFAFHTKTKVTWIQAYNNCHAENRSLASIMNRWEQDDLANAMTMNNLDEVPLWIGATDQVEEGKYRWMSEGFADMDYTNWEQGEPNNMFGDEDCAEIRFRFKWNDVPCNILNSYVCQYYGRFQENNNQ